MPNLLTPNTAYKPFGYPWAYEAWMTQQRIHWLPEEVPLADDVKDWRNKLSAAEQNLLTQIFRFFTQADVEATTTRFLILTKDRRFAYLERPVGGKGIHAAEEWSADRSRAFLMQHGESDVVEEFPDIFRKRPVVAQSAKRKVPKDNAAEPLLFPLH